MAYYQQSERPCSTPHSSSEAPQLQGEHGQNPDHFYSNHPRMGRLCNKHHSHLTRSGGLGLKGRVH